MTGRSHPSSRSANPVVTQRGHRRGITEHELHPRRRQRRVDRHIRRPGLEHRQNRHDRLGRPGKQQRHTLTRPRPKSNQQVRQPIRRLIQLAVGPRTIPAADRHRLRGARHLRGKQHRNRHRRTPPAGSTPPDYPISSKRARSPPSSRSIDDSRRVGSAVIATNTRCSRSAKSETSKFENGCPAPAVVRTSWSPNPRKFSPKSPTGPKVEYAAVAGTPARLRLSLLGMKLTTTRFAACLEPRKSPLKSGHWKPLMLQQLPHARVNMLTKIGNR